MRLYPHWARVRDGNPHGYARRVLVNLFVDSRRYAAEVPSDVLPEPVAVERDEAGLLDLGRALARLPKQMRAVVVLRYLDDRPVAEVADALGIAEGTVKSHTHRALAALHDLLASPTTGGER